MPALRRVCGYAYLRGDCTGKVQRITAHVGVCDECGAVWWIIHQRKYQAPFAKLLSVGSANGAVAKLANELIREITAQDRVIAGLERQVQQLQRRTGAN